jgi:hypothetical protein
MKMKRTSRSVLFTGLVLTLLAVSTFAVLAKELGKLDISGPGITGKITLDKPDDVGRIEGSGFFDTSALAKAPENLGTPYQITAYLNLDGKVVPFVRMEYYPAGPKETGYVHTTGRLDGETLREVDEWATMPARAESALRSVMKDHGVVLQIAVPAVVVVPPDAAAAEVAPAANAPVTREQPAVPSLPLQPVSIAAAVAAILALAGAGLMIRRRSVAR